MQLGGALVRALWEPRIAATSVASDIWQGRAAELGVAHTCSTHTHRAAIASNKGALDAQWEVRALCEPWGTAHPVGDLLMTCTLQLRREASRAAARTLVLRLKSLSTATHSATAIMARVTPPFLVVLAINLPSVAAVECRVVEQLRRVISR
jgi:hypothetical protein